MSLRTRLRIAIAALMTAVVVALSVLYAYAFLAATLRETTNIAGSVASQVQAAVAEELTARRAALQQPAMNLEEAKQFWRNTIETDPVITAVLLRALENWSVITELYITGEDGRILASTTPGRTGQQAKQAVDFSEWSRRPVTENVRQIFFDREDAERVMALSIAGQAKPVLTTHVAVSSLFIRNSLRDPLLTLLWVFGASLLVALILAILLPNIVLDPLDRLAARLDRIATGKFDGDAPGVKREAKEFAVVYTKLDLLGQQFQGAQENVDRLRTNVEHLLERLQHAVILVDPGGRLVMAGKNAGALIGTDAEALNGRQLSDVFPPDSEIGRAIDEAIRGRVALQDHIVEVDSPEGSRKFALTVEPLSRGGDQRPLGTLIMLRDADTRVELEAELGLAGRLSALSQLTRGVAHEIKNPLNAITLHLEMLRSKMEGESPEVEVISREISRLDRVVKTFLDFNRPVEPQLRRMDLDELARHLGRLIEPQASARKISVHIEGSGPLPIDGDRDLLNQAILNVLMNALEAMAEGGTLSLTTSRAGGFCALAVSDTGAGIAPEVRDRIFNLYFTTKKQGSGIGLAMAFRFVQLHNGRLEFSSETGKGTTFRFFFPEAISASRKPQTVLLGARGI